MKKKRVHRKKKMKPRKKAIKIKKRRRKRARTILSLFFIILLSVGYIIIKNMYKPQITGDNINIYINLTDQNSRAKGQLNWKYIAAIDAATNNDAFCQSGDNRIKNISNTFYVGKTNKRKTLEKTLQDLGLSDYQKADVLKISKGLEDISLRNKNEGVNSTKDSFINSLKNPSIENYRRYGVLPSITMAQAILESDWGRSSLAYKYHNFFGIKADKSWHGAKVALKTNENYNDVITANFRAYNSIEESIYDLGKFINENSLYRSQGFFNAGNYIGQANALENAGYGTAKNEAGVPIYADLLIQVIRDNNLMIYDTMI